MTRPSLLVVDDEEAIRDILLALARERGYAATGTGDAAEILPTVRQDRPSVVLLDLHMPRVDMREVLSELVAQPENPAVIVMSGYIDRDAYKLCRVHGATDVVRKPFDVDDLFRRIDAAAYMTAARRG